MCIEIRIVKALKFLGGKLRSYSSGFLSYDLTGFLIYDPLTWSYQTLFEILIFAVSKQALNIFFCPKYRVFRGAFDSAKNHKRQRRKRQSVTAKREKSQTPKFV